MDFFSFDDLAVFDTEYAVDDQVTITDTEYVFGGTTVDETQITVDGATVYDQVTITDAPVYYDPSLGLVDAPIYDPQLIVADAPLYEPQTIIADAPVYDPQLLIAETPVYDPQYIVAETPLYDPQYVVTETPLYDPQPITAQPPVYDPQIVVETYSDPSFATTTIETPYDAPLAVDTSTTTTTNISNETTVVNEQIIVSDTPTYTTTGYTGAGPGVVYDQTTVINDSVPANQTYSSTSFQAQVSFDNTSSPNNSGAQSYQQQVGQPTTQYPTHNIHTQHPAPYNAPTHGTPMHGAPSTANTSYSVPVAQHGNHATAQGISFNPHHTPYTPTPSSTSRPSIHAARRTSVMNGLNAAAKNPMVKAFVKKPLGSLASLGRKPTAQALMQNLSISSPGGSVMNMVSSSVKATTDLCTNLVQNGIVAAPDIGTLAVNTVGLAWRAGAYAYHSSGMKKQLAICLDEYCRAGHLQLQRDLRDPKQASWQTTKVFHDAKFLLRIYKDIEQYLKAAKVSDAEIDALGWRDTVTIHTQKKIPNAVQQLSTCCEAFGLRNPTETDLETRINVVSFPHIGVISLTNAFLVESERRRRRESAGQPPEHHLVPVLGRVLSLAAICGIREICLSDITLLLGKAPMFETVARARIASLRKHHASHTINTMLFGGSTESAARDFAQQAMQFKDQRMLVGRIVAPSTARFDPAWANARCVFTGDIEAGQPIGTPIYMLAGWARLIVQREALPGVRAANAAPASQILCADRDVHGNAIVHPGNLGPLTFTVKVLADGTLMAKPRKFDRWDYLGSSNYKQGHALVHATGEEKHFGGLVGPAHCGCVADQRKARLTREWKYSDELGITSRKTVLNSIQHTKELSAEKISILWSPGDWAKGVFWMQTLPQSSYLQGRGECLHCAVENAALAGCPEVIACGGGRVTAAAKRAAAAAAAAGNVARPAAQPNASGVVPTGHIAQPAAQLSFPHAVSGGHVVQPTTQPHVGIAVPPGYAVRSVSQPNTQPAPQPNPLHTAPAGYAVRSVSQPSVPGVVPAEVARVPVQQPQQPQPQQQQHIVPVSTNPVTPPPMYVSTVPPISQQVQPVQQIQPALVPNASLVKRKPIGARKPVPSAAITKVDSNSSVSSANDSANIHGAVTPVETSQTPVVALEQKAPVASAHEVSLGLY